MSEHKTPRSPLRVTPQPSPKIGKSGHTRAAILNAALDFLWSRPFRELTVSSLMAPTGLSRSAFYQYFSDLTELMEGLLTMVEEEILVAAAPWVVGVGDPVALVREAIAAMVNIGHQRGPFLRAVSDAAAANQRLEAAWKQFLDRFDDAATERIEADQEQGLIPPFDVRPVAVALNRLDAHALIHAFGQHPMSPPEPVRDALSRIWICSLYGSEWLETRSSTLIRT